MRTIKILSTLFGVGLFAALVGPALAAGEFEKQLRMSDGYTEPATASATRLGAAGRPAQAPDSAWFMKQLKQTDGYSEPAALPTARPGAAGRPGQSPDNAWFMKELKQSDSR